MQREALSQDKAVTSRRRIRCRERLFDFNFDSFGCLSGGSSGVSELERVFGVLRCLVVAVVAVWAPKASEVRLAEREVLGRRCRRELDFDFDAFEDAARSEESPDLRLERFFFECEGLVPAVEDEEDDDDESSGACGMLPPEFDSSATSARVAADADAAGAPPMPTPASVLMFDTMSSRREVSLALRAAKRAYT